MVRLMFVLILDIILCTLGNRLAVGRVTLDHVGKVRILLPQPAHSGNIITIVEGYYELPNSAVVCSTHILLMRKNYVRDPE